MSTKKSLIFLAATITLCISVKCAVGQSDVNQGDLSRMLDTNSDYREITKTLEFKLQELEEARLRLNSTGGRVKKENNQSIPESRLRLQVDNIRLNETEATREIQQSIELMKKFMEKKLAVQPMNPSDSAPLAIASPKSVPDLKPSLDEMLNSGTADSVFAVADPENNPTLVTSAERVLPNPVNVFEMANSLFQTGNPEAALDAYNAVERNEITAFDSIWLDYMIACCNRHLGNLDDAETGYRQIANEKQRLHPVDESMKWLTYLGNSRDTKELYAQLDIEIESLLKRAQSHVAK